MVAALQNIQKSRYYRKSQDKGNIQYYRDGRKAVCATIVANSFPRSKRLVLTAEVLKSENSTGFHTN